MKANPYEKPWSLYLRIMHLLYSADMTVVEICCGTAPAARAAAFLGISSISFDIRGNQIEAACSSFSSFFNKFKEQPV